jgi:hypothetical protein
MLSFLVLSVCYLTLAGVMIVMISPYILRISDERILIYSAALSTIGIAAILVGIHFFVEWITGVMMGFRFHDLFSLQTAVILFYAYTGIRIMGFDMKEEKFV